MSITIKICGPRGSGKTTLAKVIQEALTARGINPHLSNAKVDWSYIEVAQKLDNRIVTIDEIEDGLPMSDDEICRKIVKRLLARCDGDDDIHWYQIEDALTEYSRSANHHLGHDHMRHLASRAEQSLEALGFNSTRCGIPHLPPAI
jgi:energy-coupling factor transporter ATP-binding protein EcfA2